MVFVLWILFKSVVGLTDRATLEAAMGLLRTWTLESERSAFISAHSLNQRRDPGQDTHPL